MKQKTLFIASAVVLLAAFVVGVLVYNIQRADGTAEVVKRNPQALTRLHSPTLGNADAKVHIVEFLDPACGTCAQFSPFVKDLMAANPGRIRLTVRYAPLHQGSEQVVRVLEAARKQGKFWQALEALFATQRQWVQNHVAHAQLAWNSLAGLGLDLDRVRADMNAPEVTRIVEQDIADTRTLNVTQTPEFFVNGRAMPSFGAQQLKDLVDEEIAKGYR
jgi:protein-disulfide isomerase